MVLGFVMYLVAIAFTINIANSLKKVDGKDAAIWNLFLGAVIILVVFLGIIQSWFGEGTFWWAAQVMLFGLTYLFLGINGVAGLDGRGVGWFCFFVAVYMPVPTYQVFLSGDIKLGVCYAVWAVLWLMFWVALGLQKGGAALGKAILALQFVVAVFTLYLPSIMIMNGWW
ncbi:MAG: AmiS/UreI family transporter [Gracilibacteraceae bacterium]|jgi:hypothetical protein|nr:AmiS/UreI family transporter [Gracilibacteraceae bacterium]